MAAAGLLATAGIAHAAFVIDDFSDTQTLRIFSGSGMESSTLVDPVSAIAGTRTLSIENSSGLSTASVNEISQFVLSVVNGPTSNATVTVTWSGIDSVYQDFTGGGTVDSIAIGFSAPIDNRLTVGFTVNGLASFARDFEHHMVGQSFLFPFASFTDPGVFTSVSELMMVLSSPDQAWDADVFLPPPPLLPVQIPVPGTLALVGLGLGVFGFRRRQRAHADAD